MILNKVINLNNWQRRNLNVGYGTRDKVVVKQTKKGKVYFLAKSYDKDIGELRSEVCSSNIGRLFNFSVQRTWLCKIPQYRVFKLKHPLGVLIQLDVRRQRDTRRGQFREDLKHGSALISLVSKDFLDLKNETERRKAYTLELVVNSIRNYAKNHSGSEIIWKQFFDLLSFDALIGGTDRHYNNWGVLEKADDGSFLRLAPAFDNGISLMWLMDTYRPIFMKDLWTRNFPNRARSMFKKVGGGNFTLFEVLDELYKLGDYRHTGIANELLQRLNAVDQSRIKSAAISNVPRRVGFKTELRELGLVCEYVKVRLAILKQTLARIAKKYDATTL